MTDIILSPDGKFMWTGDQWIPTPPNSKGSSLNMQDSVISGDVITTNIHNDPSMVTAAIVTALQQLGMLNSPQQQAPPDNGFDLPASFSVGDHVEYYSPTNQRWLNRCKVTGINNDGTYKIEVPKTDKTETKYAVVIGNSLGTIRPASAPYSTGDRVFVNWKNYGHFYSGSISKKNADETYQIHFDDGDVEDGVEWGRIEPLNESSQEVKDYIHNDSTAEDELVKAFQVFDPEHSGTILAKDYMKILTEYGDSPLTVEEVLSEFASLEISMDSQLDYFELAKYLVGSELMANTQPTKPDVVIRDAYVEAGLLKGYAYAHPRFGESNIKSSPIQSISYDERATGRVETRDIIYVVGPTGWKVQPEDHPFNSWN